MLLNLFSNAIKFTGRKGKIEIVTKLRRNHVKIYVRDSGIGIQHENQGKIFQLFGSIKDEKKELNTNGIGLGLVISKMIVEKFKGTINFDSKFEEGTQFYFDFEVERPKESSVNVPKPSD